MPDKILYCRCAFAQVVPQATKDLVLEKLCESGASFETVADLCEMSARKDPRLLELIARAPDEKVQIAACYPRAVKWLFHNAGIPFPSDDAPGQIQVHNMREENAETIVENILQS